MGELFAVGEDALAVPDIAPLEYLDLDVPDAPLVHRGLGWFIEIDGVGSGEGPSVVIDDKMFTGVGDPECGSGGPARPVSGCTVDFRTELQVRAEGVFASVGDVV